MTTRIRSCAPRPSRRSPASTTRTDRSAHHDSTNGEGSGPAERTTRHQGGRVTAPQAPAWTPAPPPEPETITEVLKRYRVKVKNAKNAASINQRSLKDRGVDPERELEKTGLGRTLSAVMDAVVPPVKEHIDNVCAELLEHLAALENRIKELEKTPQIHWCERWTEGQYEPGALVELGGSAWVCKRRTKSKPSPGRT